MRQPTVRAALFAAALWAAAPPSLAARDLRPGIIGTDDRRAVDVASVPWVAVGQVNVARYRRRASCTGTLIGPDRVVTAAHCITDASTGKVLPLRSIHFLTGVFGARWKEHAQPRCIILPKTRRQRAATAPRRPPKAHRLAWFVDDVAVLVLDKRLAAPPIAIEGGDAPAPEALAHAAYAGDRRHRLTADLGCALRGVSAEGLWLTDCDTQKAGSGGPVLVKRDGRYALAAVMVGVAGKRFTVALPAAHWRGLARQASCPAADGTR